MKTILEHNKNSFIIDFNDPLDISIPIMSNGVCAWGVDQLKIEPHIDGLWIGDVSKGAVVNFNNISFNPHAHCTHTECVGHISPQKESINSQVKQFFFIAKLITVLPKKKNSDCVITKNMIESSFVNNENVDALIIRTLPNNDNKKKKNYFNSNHPYLVKAAVDYIVDNNINHILIDLPSIDKEKDEGHLTAHKAFWKFPDDIRLNCTITELIYVPDSILDGLYLLNLQFSPFENDASPSRPVLFKLKSIKHEY
ncbi:MAG: metal-dependent hydrolase [Flavobacteriales bacterium]|jgi:arylformamidase|nr:metal-dependent hydrolase [Flavobacteriales bacterium]|tara:strand:- start:29860 stop:30621 length:762 start_codon:yes stop_codon:yes gene_type:complete